MKTIEIPDGCKAIRITQENDLLIFEFEPIKRMPKQNELVYVASINNLNYYSSMLFNYNSLNHCNMYELGLIFYTEKEAVEKAKSIIEFLRK